MDANGLELARHFREMSDEELIDQCSSGTLTDSAQSIAMEEISSRGLELPGPVSTSYESAEYEGDFETVARFLNPTDAHVVCSCLGAAGVPAMVADANLVQTNALWTVAVGGVRVLVPASRVVEAKQVIEAFGRGDFALRDEGDSDSE